MSRIHVAHLYVRCAAVFLWCGYVWVYKVSGCVRWICVGGWLCLFYLRCSTALLRRACRSDVLERKVVGGCDLRVIHVETHDDALLCDVDDDVHVDTVAVLRGGRVC